MTYPEFAGNSTTGIGNIFLYAKTIIPFYDSILFTVILLVITFASYFIQEQKRGKGDFIVSFSVGCTSTTVLIGIIQLLTGFTSGTVVGVFIALTVVSYMLLFFSEP